MVGPHSFPVLNKENHQSAVEGGGLALLLIRVRIMENKCW